MWDDLLVRAEAVDPELARRLDLFRACGCALEVVDGQVRFGPHDDVADCDWADADDWEHDYRDYLGAFEEALRGLLAELLPPEVRCRPAA